MTSRVQSGFTLVEMLVAMMLMLVVVGAVVALVVPAEGLAQEQPDAVDMQQRARVGADMLTRDLVMAGAGLDSGPAVGPLVNYLPPIVPRRMGLQNADASTAVRTDALTVYYVPATPIQTSVSALLTPPVLELEVSAPAGCPVGLPVCGVVAGTELLVFDTAGHFDTFGATQVSATSAQLQHRATDVSWTYPVGSSVAQVATHVYYFDAINAQLRHYDGVSTDVPVIDNVTGLSFTYFGDPRPPTQPKPPLGVDNCLYDAAGNPKPMPVLAQNTSLVALPASMLSDGPWCGSGSSAFDADLLRVRTVRVTLRVQAASTSLRATGSAYALPGLSLGAERQLPDYVVTFEIAPRNLSLGR
jgi:prepilin-type N-terminal cleavage/methylation domain-containing protein